MVNNPQSRMLEPLDDKSGQWFGATMTASGVDGSVAVSHELASTFISKTNATVQQGFPERGTETK